MNRLAKIIVHIIIFAIGLPAVAFSDFWDWNLLRGMVLPIVATGFLFYLVLFLLSGGYKVFGPSYSDTDA